MRYIIMILLVVFLSVPVMAQTEVPPPDDVAEDLVEATVAATENTAETLQEFVDQLLQPPESELVQVLMVLGGVLLLVVGWRIYDYIILVAGFLMGASIAVSLVTTDSEWMMLLIFLIGGLVGLALSYFLYQIAVFIIGAYLGILLTSSLAIALDLTPVSALALLIGGLIGGIILLGLSFELLVLVSAVVGAQLLTLALNLDGIWTVILALIGIVVQFGLMRSFKYSFRRRARLFRG